MTSFKQLLTSYDGLSRWFCGKELTCDAWDRGSIPGGEDPLDKEMATTPVFLPGKSHGQRSLVSYSPWGHKSWTWLTTKQQQQTSYDRYYTTA